MADPSPLPSIKTPWNSAMSPADGAPDQPMAPFVAVPDHTLLRRIGQGAYGEVWLARNVLGQHRAVKLVLRGAFESDRPFEREFAGIQRFEPISRSHESQLNILHVGRAADVFYYVMELADNGERQKEEGRIQNATAPASETPTSAFSILPSYFPRTLRSELRLRGRLPVEECIRLGLALSTALEHLHRHGLVHRDIKPSNIVFVNGIPKLADIGLVALAERTMSFVGTEGYLPPEGPGTVQADIFSLGKVLYEIATGHDRQQFPDLPTQVQELTDRAALAEFNEVLLRACAPDSKQRYQTAAELHADLALLQSGKSVARMRWVERRLRFVARAGALVSGIALLAALAFVYQRLQTKEARRLAEENRRLAIEARNNEQIARENFYAADISLAHQALLTGNLRQARPLLEAHTPQPGQADEGMDVAFAPDDRLLASIGTYDGVVKLWNLEAAPKREFFHEPIGPLGFAPSGALLAVDAELNTIEVDPVTLDTRRRPGPPLTSGAAYLARFGIPPPAGESTHLPRYVPYLGNPAPGVGILSTLPGGKYGLLDGTSMATPHVTGACALYLSSHPLAGSRGNLFLMEGRATASPGLHEKSMKCGLV